MTNASPPDVDLVTPDGMTGKFAAELVPHLVPIDELTLDPANTRAHNERNLRLVAKSMDKFGQVQVALRRRETGVLVIGNGRCEAARRILGWTHFAVISRSLTDAQATHLSILDNRTSELASWNVDALQEIEPELLDLKDAGWTQAELDNLLKIPDDLDLGHNPGAAARLKGITFTLSKDQHDTVWRVLNFLIDTGHGEDETNGHKLSNALAYLCAEYDRQHKVPA